MENCINIYNQFLENVQSLTDNDTTAFKDNIEERLNRFYESLQNEDTFSLFCMTKIKVFSAKTEETFDVSSSLFGKELTLKHIFNNQSDNIKNQLWELLLNLYIQLERVKNNNQTKILAVKDGLKKHRQTNAPHNIRSDVFKNVLNADVNSTTNNMLDDIIGSFQNVVSNKGNPFENIMGITDMITSKYGDMIENGEIEIDKILGGMGGLLNKGMGDIMGGSKKEEPVIIDDNFSTADVEIGKEEEEKKGGFNFSKLMPLANMVNKINSIKTEDDVKLLKQDMDSFMEKELKVDMSQYKENMEKLEKKLEESKIKDKIVEEVKPDID